MNSFLLAAAFGRGPGGGTSGLTVLFLVGVAIVALIAGGFVFKFGGLWIQAHMSGAPVGFFDLIGMSLRRVPPALIVQARISSKKAGMEIPAEFWEAHYLAGGKVMELCRALITAHQGKMGVEPGMLASHVLAGGRVQDVVVAMISARRADIDLPLNHAFAIDLATLRTEGKNVVEAVTTSVNPRVIDCPDASKGRSTIDAVAKDGIQLRARARVTVRTNLARILGGATEETIIARVGEGIVSAIGSAGTHKEVLENPDRISKAVLNKSLDSQTAFEIVSIDIADVDVGTNIGAKLQADQAEADMRRAQAEAERRRAMAVANEQEMKAKVAENRALVVLAEAEVPKALAESLRTGKMGFMDYYNLRNIQSDTQMREQIGGNKEHGVQ